MGSLFRALRALVLKNLKLKKADIRGLVMELLVPVILCYMFVSMGNIIASETTDASLDVINVTSLKMSASVQKLYLRFGHTNDSIALIPPNHPLSAGFKDMLSAFSPRYDLLPHVLEFESVEAVYKHNENPVKDNFQDVTMLVDLTDVNLDKKIYTYDVKDVDTSSALQPTLYDLYTREDKMRYIRMITADIAVSNLMKYSALFHEGYYAGETDLKKIDNIDVNLKTMPTLEQTDNVFGPYMNSVMGGIFTLSFSGSAQSVVSLLVAERECLIRSTFLMMGASKYMLYLSHMISQLIVSALPLAICTMFLTRHLYLSQSPIVLGALLFAYFCTITIFCFLLSTFFSKAKTALSATSLVFMLMSCSAIALSFIPDTIAKVVMIFNFQNTFAMANRTLHFFETHGESVTPFSNMFSSTQNSISIGLALLIFAFQSVMYFLLAVYMDNIMPGEYNNPLPFYYPLTLSYWRSVFNGGVGSSTTAAATGAYQSLLDGDSNATHPSPSSHFIQPYTPQEQQQVGVRISNVTKDFSTNTGTVRAVDHLSLNLVKNQISVLLGHNGSGKSTTVSMISGLYPPTSGTIDVFDKNGNRLDDVTGHIGICMQQNTLLEKLTVFDHMIMFSAIKQHSMGIELSEAEVLGEIMDLLNRLKLGPLGDDKVQAQIHTLSGGQKRKVCLALALLHRPTIIVLDECTTGVDINIQRQIWKLIQEEKSRDGGKTILLLTHSLEEAEIGDRISVLCKGDLQCSGSSSFLKSAFNVGYLLQLDKIKQPGVFDRLHKTDTSVNRDTTNKKFGDANELNNINTQSGLAIQTKLDTLPDGLAEKLSVHTDTQHHIIFSIDLGDSDHLPDIIDAIDAMKADLQITNTALSITSLTDVFLLANSGYTQEYAESHRSSDDTANMSLNDSVDSARPAVSKITSSKSSVKKDSHNITINTEIWDSERVHLHFALLFLLQVWAIFWKRVLMSIRDIKSLGKIVLLPMVTVALLVWLNRSTFSGQVLSLDYRGFPTPANIEYSSMNNPQADVVMANALSKAFATYPGANPIEKDLTKYVKYTGQNFIYDESEYMVVFNKSVDDYLFDSPRYVAINTYQATLDKTEHTASVTGDLYINSTSIWTAATYSSRFFETLAEQVGLPTLRFTETTQGMPMPVISDIIRGAVLFGIFLCCITFPPAIVFLLVKEREDKIFHLHRISGLSSTAYFTANFLFDGLQFAIMCGILIGGVLIFNLPIPPPLIHIIRALAAYGVISIIFVYALSFLFKKPSTAQIAVSLLLTVGPAILIGILALILKIIEYRGSWMNVFKLAYLIPSAGLGMSFTNLLLSQYMETESPGSIIIKWLIISPLYVVLLMALNMVNNYRLIEQLFDSPMSITPRPAGVEVDENVLAQQAFVEGGTWRSDTDQNPLVVSGLRKVYNGKTAVNNIYFSVPRNSIVGLLGANGSGKSTTLAMLTAEIWASQSLESKYDHSITHDAYIFGHSIRAEPSQSFRHLGFCPQFDCFNLELSARQTLRMYCHLRGVVGEKAELFIADLLNVLGLDYAADRPASGYSMGMRRRLSLGLSMAGNPEVLLIDEAASGLDPISRKSIQLLLQQTCKNRTVLMTSHAMDEVDALCDSLLIMARSNLKASGTQSELKEKLGNEFTIQLTCDMGLEDVTACQVMSALSKTPINPLLQQALDKSVLDKKHKEDEYNRMLLQANGAPISPTVVEYTSHGESPLHQSPFYKQFLFECQTNGIRIAEQRHCSIALNIQKRLSTLSGLFNNVKKLRDSISSIQTYACSQIPIDQVFMEIIKQDETAQPTGGTALDEQYLAFQQYRATQELYQQPQQQVQYQQQPPQQVQYQQQPLPNPAYTNLFTPEPPQPNPDDEKKLE